jgi:predicted DCC family thiol-disulfide oxidoreductase YuxK
VPGLDIWYTNNGLLPNHTVLWRPSFDWVFSLFFMASWPSEVAVGFVVCALVYLMLLVGVRTRLAHVLSLLCVLSLHGRVLFIQNGGDVVLVELCAWALFLPTGRRYSWDSLRARLRAHPDQTADDLANREAFAPDSSPVVSLAVLALVGQLAIIYAFNAIQKDGPTWRTGSVFHYMLHCDGIVTALGAWVRTWLTLPASRVLTWGAWALEAALPFVLLSPFRQRTTRHVAMAMVVALHAGFALFLNLGIFVPAMLGFVPFLIPAADWEATARWWARRPGTRIVIFDGDCGVCFQIVRALARLDTAGRLRLIASEAVIRGHADVAPYDLSGELLAQTIVVVDPLTGRRWLRAAGFAEIAAFLPLGALVAWPLRLPGLRRLAASAYDAFAARRTEISIALGLAACGVPAPARMGTDEPESSRISRPSRLPPTALDASTLGRWSARSVFLRESVVGFALVLASAQVLVDNPRVTHVNRSWQPTWMAAATSYLQFQQSWAMFAPDAPLIDANVTVDAITVDGRHVDPLNQVASPKQPRPGLRIPPRLGQDGFFSAYMLRVPSRDDYFGALTEWILRYPERTGSQQDEIVSFEAFYVEDDSPPPGAREPRNTRITRMIQVPPGTP